MRYLPLLLLLLAACTPTSPQPQRAVVFSTQRPSPSITPYDVQGIRDGIALQMAQLQQTEQAAGIGATMQVAEITKIAADRQWQLTQKTIEADAAHASSTAEAQQTGTAEAQPYAQASITALADDVSSSSKRADVQRALEWPRQLTFFLVLGAIILAILRVSNAVARAILARITPQAEERDSSPAPAPEKAEPIELIIHSNEGRTMQKMELPCTAEEMDVLAFWAVVRGERSLAINLWQSRGLSGHIPEIRLWAVAKEFATKDDKGYIEWNDRGMEMLAGWKEQRPSPSRPSSLSLGHA